MSHEQPYITLQSDLHIQMLKVIATTHQIFKNLGKFLPHIFINLNNLDNSMQFYVVLCSSMQLFSVFLCRFMQFYVVLYSSLQGRQDTHTPYPYIYIVVTHFQRFSVGNFTGLNRTEQLSRICIQPSADLILLQRYICILSSLL